MTRLIKNVNKVSKLFQPLKIYPKDAVIKSNEKAKSYRLMLDMGIIQQANPGMYTLLPLGQRVLEKIIAIVDNEMSNIGAQKMLLPNLTSSNLWKKTKRIVTMAPELFKLNDRHMDPYILSPTYEEAITSLIAKSGVIYKGQLPLLLYQISTKWRDEMKPRLGFFRSREFIMKDLYSFDSTLEYAKNTYDLVNRAYVNIFSQIGIPYTVALADTGLMGGSLSHEYHYLSEIGEDTVLYCTSCDVYINSTLQEESTCKKCGEELTKETGIEVGHTFLLGPKYSKIFEAMCPLNEEYVPFEMGCYGLGLSRLMAAAVEILSTNEEIRWPKSIAPFTVCLLPPKERSKESKAGHYVERMIEILTQNNIDFIVDDRIHLTIGRRLIDVRRTGYPYIVIVGKSAILPEPRFEFYDVNKAEQANISFDQLLDFFNNLNRNNNVSESNQDDQQEDSNVKFKSIYVNSTSTVSNN